MNANQVSIEQAIALVENQLGSVFTKEDVINLINRIELPKPASATELSPELRILVLKEYKSTIEQTISNNADERIIDIDSADFIIGYGNRIEIDCISIDNYSLENIVENAIEEVITGLEDAIYERDKEKEEIEESTEEGILEDVQSNTDTHNSQIEAQHDTFSEDNGGQVAESN